MADSIPNSKAPSGEPPLRVLIVDDSAINRSSLAVGFATSPDIEVVGTASDGGEALRLVRTLEPDAITLDLEMPRMNGFSFLRLLMNSRPTPVIVVSSYSNKENVFRALELGAVDFVAKPDGDRGRIEEIHELLLQKLQLIRSLRRGSMNVRTRLSIPVKRDIDPSPIIVETKRRTTPEYIVAIAASTGGPTAVTEIVSQLAANPRYAVLIAQHMPEKFTRTFAQRLDRYSTLEICEAVDGDVVSSGLAFVCPGRQCMELVRGSRGIFQLKVGPPKTTDRYVPSANRLFKSVVDVVGAKAIGVVLTGMGDDGLEGAQAIHAAGGKVVAESEQTAIVYGMPRAVERAGVATRSLPVQEIARYLTGLLET